MRKPSPCRSLSRSLSSGSAILRVDLLGPVTVSVDGEAVPLRPTGRTLLARLALVGGHLVATDQLVEDLWGTARPANPLDALRVTVSRARRALGPHGPALCSGHAGYRLDADTMDVIEFESLARAGRTKLAGGDAPRAAALLRDALALWRGGALADVGQAPFIDGQARRLEAERSSALDARIAADLACGRHAELVSELELLVREHPFDEQIWAHRMLALYRCGRQADALRAFGEVRALLRDELGLEPGAALRRLEEAVLHQRVELDLPSQRAVAEADAHVRHRGTARRASVRLRPPRHARLL